MKVRAILEYPRLAVAPQGHSSPNGKTNDTEPTSLKRSPS